MNIDVSLRSHISTVLSGCIKALLAIREEGKDAFESSGMAVVFRMDAYVRKGELL